MSNNEITSALLARRNANVSSGIVTAHPIFAARAEGSYLWDAEGKQYLDFVGGIGVLNTGHNHPRVIAAVQKQLQRITHAAFQVAAYDVYVDLAERLNKLVGGPTPNKSAFFTTGAEAVENAIKMARAYRGVPGVIAFDGGFHGRTLLGLTLTGMSTPYKQNFGPYAGDIYHVPYPDDYQGFSEDDAIAHLEAVFATRIAPEKVAAIIIEPVQGDGGFRPAGVGFLRRLRAITEQHGIVLISDEIQAGFGRTGTMFGFQQAGIQPDLITVAKSLAGGFPLSGVVGKAEIVDAPQPGGLGGTYGGNAVACAAALAILDLFEEEQILEKSVKLGEALQVGLRKIAEVAPEIGTVRGVGPMVAIEFVTNQQPNQPDAAFAQRVIDAAREEGLLVIKCGIHRNIIRLLAPVTTSLEDAHAGLQMLESAIQKARVAQ
jgi:4-aminobutyrate aminotransferase/(S)-3-amino-2-methylpropionate transaminase